jgi:hypothetical protein
VGLALSIGDTLRLAGDADTVSLPAGIVELVWVSVRSGRRNDFALKGTGIGALGGVTLRVQLERTPLRAPVRA